MTFILFFTREKRVHCYIFGQNLKMEYFLLIYFNKLSVFLLKGKQTDDSSFCEKLQRLKPKLGKLSREGKFMHWFLIDIITQTQKYFKQTGIVTFVTYSTSE